MPNKMSQGDRQIESPEGFDQVLGMDQARAAPLCLAFHYPASIISKVWFIVHQRSEQIQQRRFQTPRGTRVHQVGWSTEFIACKKEETSNLSEVRQWWA